MTILSPPYAHFSCRATVNLRIHREKSIQRDWRSCSAAADGEEHRVSLSLCSVCHPNTSGMLSSLDGETNTWKTLVRCRAQHCCLVVITEPERSMSWSWGPRFPQLSTEARSQPLPSLPRSLGVGEALLAYPLFQGGENEKNYWISAFFPLSVLETKKASEPLQKKESKQSPRGLLGFGILQLRLSRSEDVPWLISMLALCLGKSQKRDCEPTTIW